MSSTDAKCPVCSGRLLLNERTMTWSCQRPTAFCSLNMTAFMVLMLRAQRDRIVP